MKGYFACLFGFLLIARVQADENYVTGGINASRFYDVGSKPLLGYSLGYGREWRISKSSAMTLGISCFQRGACLNNKTIHPTGGDMVYIFDIFCRMGYIDIPFSYKWYFAGIAEKRFYMTTGLAASLAVYDVSQREKLREWSDHYFSEEKADFFLEPRSRTLYYR